MSITQRALDRVANRILYEINTIREEGTVGGTGPALAHWYGLDRLAAIQEVAAAALAGDEDASVIGYGGEATDFDAAAEEPATAWPRRSRADQIEAVARSIERWCAGQGIAIPQAADLAEALITNSIAKGKTP